MQNLQRQIIRQQYFTSCANTLAGRPCAYYFCFIRKIFLRFSVTRSFL